jgi:hypothetical protein
LETIWENKSEIKKREGVDDIIKLIKLTLVNHYSYHVDLAKFGYILHMKVIDEVAEKSPQQQLKVTRQ